MSAQEALDTSGGNDILNRPWDGVSSPGTASRKPSACSGQAVVPGEREGGGFVRFTGCQLLDQCPYKGGASVGTVGTSQISTLLSWPRPKD